MSLTYGLPKGENSPVLSVNDVEHAKINNQFCLSGVDPSFPSDLTKLKVVVFLEYAMPTAGTLVIQDANANALTGASAEFQLQDAPLRVDGGLKIIGSVAIAKGFFIICDKLTSI